MRKLAEETDIYDERTPEERAHNAQINALKWSGKKITRTALRITKMALKLIFKSFAVVLKAMLSFFGIATIPILLVVLLVAALYLTPFSIFLPKITEDQTVQEVTAEYFTEYERKVMTELDDVSGYDGTEFLGAWFDDGVGNREQVGELIVDAGWIYKDVILTYMVRRGVDDLAAVMNDKGRRRLREVFDDMVTLETGEYSYVMTLTRELTDGAGQPVCEEEGPQYETYDVNVRIKTVAVVLHGADEMAQRYSFSRKKLRLFDELRGMLNEALPGRENKDYEF